ncbi:MAG: hypothetical protein GQ569_13125 [Methylococcaceae bacterium]|nr:hypothetical protein [Methylococcaceae bacterium]
MQKSNQRLTHKLIFLFLFISILPIAVIGYWSYWSGKDSLEKQFLNDFTAIAQSKAEAINYYLDSEIMRIEDFASDGNIYKLLEQSLNNELEETEISAQLNTLLRKKIVMTNSGLTHGYYETLVLNHKGKVLGSTSPASVRRDESNNDFFTKALNKIYIKDVYHENSSNQYAFAVSGAIRNHETGQLLGVVVNRLSIASLNEIVTNHVGLGETGEAYIVNKDGYMITDSRFSKDVILKQKVDTEPVRLFHAQQQNMAGIYPDYRGTSIVGVSDGKTISKISDLGWLLLVEIDEEEADQEINKLGFQILLFGGIMVALALGLGIFYGRSLSRPISSATQDIFTTSTELSATTEEHERTAAQQAAAVNETSATMNELGRSAQQSISQAESANTNAQTAVIHAREGAKTMHEMLASMEELRSRVDNIGSQILRLSEQTSQIGNVTEAVKDIANQTNLLALNAAVEATRAGEHGKGFTVVSQEIRKLAEQSKKSAEHISNLVDNIQKVTNATVLAAEAGTQTAQHSGRQVENAQQGFDVLSDSVNKIAEVLQQISLTAKQQSNATNQVVEAMNMLNTGAKETANGISQSKSAIQNLNKAAEQLQSMV